VSKEALGHAYDIYKGTLNAYHFLTPSEGKEKSVIVDEIETIERGV